MISQREGLLGVWHLVCWESRSRDGRRSYPFGREAKGRLVYDAAGYMSGQMMRGERARFASDRLRDSTDPELAAAARGYIAYSGTYSVQEGEGTVTHHVDMSLFPNWVETDQVRRFELSGDWLILGAENEGTELVMVWERAG